MTKERAPRKLSFGLKIGYGAGTAADSITYTLFYTYFLYFLTDVVGMNPGIGGTISFIAILWDAVTDPVVGFWSDNAINPAGRRRPFILRSVWPLAVSVFLLFIPVQFSEVAQIVYFLMASLLVWTFYTTYVVPWTALGAELTQDYNERNMIRMYVGILAYPCLLFAMSGPMYIIALLAPMGLTEGQCWMVTAALSGIIIIVCGLITARTTKGRDVPAVREKGDKFKFSFKVMISQYADYFRMKDYARLTFFQLIYIVGYTLMSNGNVYMLANLAGLDEAQQGVFWTVFSLVAFASIPLITWVANRWSKKVCMVVFSIVFLAECLLFFIIGIHGFVGALIFGIGIAVATSSYFGIFYAMFYDLCEVFELRTGKRAEGGILAVATFTQKLGAAFGALALGWILEGVGYQGTGEESALAMKGILAVETIIPAVLVLASLYFLGKYSLSRSRFALVTKALEAKREGREPELAGIEMFLK